MAKRLMVVLVVFGLFSTVHAGTLRNRDFRQYHLEVLYPNGMSTRMIVPSGATLNGFCAYDGCAVILLETRDRANVGPNDEVEIFYGRLQVRRSLFR